MIRSRRWGEFRRGADGGLRVTMVKAKVVKAASVTEAGEGDKWRWWR